MTSWLSKLGFGLKKSSAPLSSGLGNIFSRRRLDSATLDELEELLICSDMGVSAAAKIIKDFSARKIDKDATDEDIRRILADSLQTILQPCEKKFDLGQSRPTVIMMVGVNGAGKTTTIGKLISRLKHNPMKFSSETIFNEKDEDVSAERKTGVYTKVHEDLSTEETPHISTKNGLCQISLIAGDTFRAAAVEQLSVWGERNGVRIFSGAPGCDAAGLCFDGLQEAIRQKDDIVFIDTAGRLQNKTNLIEELQKVVRVIKKVIPDAPHHTLLCLDAATGQNALDQVKTFKTFVDVNGLIINKLDGTAKGGILAAIAAESPTPVYFIGIGEGIDDLQEFNAGDYSRSLLGID